MTNHARNRRAVGQLGGISRGIRAIGVRAEHLQAVGPQIGSMLSRAVQRQFSTKGAYMGTPWKPLSPATLIDKARQGYATPNPLVRTGRLKMSFVGRPMDIERYGKNGFRFGSSLDRAVWQQKGTRRNGRRHIPPRKIMVITRGIRSDITKKIANYVIKGKLT